MRSRILFSLALLAAALVGIRALRQAKDPAPASGLGEEARLRPQARAMPSKLPVPAALPSAVLQEDRVRRYRELHARLNEVRESRVEAADREGRARTDRGSEAQPRSPPPLPTLDKDYIQEQMKEIVPLFAECYEIALETEPEIHGRVVIETKLIGEEGVGGLIESSEVLAEESDIVSPAFLQCVSETMYALELRAPESGGSVVIRYPLHFDKAEDDL